MIWKDKKSIERKISKSLFIGGHMIRNKFDKKRFIKNNRNEYRRENRRIGNSSQR